MPGEYSAVRIVERMVRWRDLEHEWRDLEQIWFRAEKSVICE